MSKTKAVSKKGKELNKNKLVLTIVCILVAIVLIFGIVMGTVVGVKNARAVISYKGITLDSGEVSYLYSYYKNEFMIYLKNNAVVPYDNEDFWNEENEIEKGKTYGESLREFCEYSIKEFLVFNYIFDSGASLSSADKERIKEVTDEFLLNMDSSVEKFNLATEAYGFDFGDFKDITKMLYKYHRVRYIVENANADSIQSLSSSWDERVEDYYETYSHVKLLFIRTEETFMLDENGNRVRDENNKDILIPLSDAEKAKRQETINEVRAAISAYEENTTDIQMSPTMFNNYLVSAGEGDPTKNNVGYYFSENSAYSREFSEAFADIVNKSLEMKEKTYSEVAFDGGVCFIYKYERASAAYTDAEAGGCFSDFYVNVAVLLVEEIMAEAATKVKVKDSFYETDLVALPYNYDFVPTF